MTDIACLDCGHTHAGPELAGICIGCPCQTRPAKTSDLHRFSCMTKGCGTARISSRNLTSAKADSEARTLGWTIWSGTTLSGADSTAIYCPTHAGKHSEPGVGELVEDGWDAECDTCDSTASEEWSDEALLTEADAEDWMSQHHCESEVRLIRPTRKQAVA